MDYNNFMENEQNHNNDKNEQNNAVNPELMQKLEAIKCHCTPPTLMHHKTFYLFLFICSIIVYYSHSLIANSLDWNAIRISYGILPINVLMMRNTIISVFLPVVITIFFLLSFKFKFLRSANFLTWFTLILFGVITIYIWMSGIFFFNLLNCK